MRRLKIKTALTANLLVIGLMAAGFSVYSVDRLYAANAKLGEIANARMPALERVKDIEVRLGDIRTGYRTHMLQRDRPGKDAAVKLIEESVERLSNDEDVLEQLSSDERQRVLLGEIRKNFSDYMARGKNVLALSDDGRQDEAIAMLKQVMMKRAEALRAASTQLTDITNEASRAAYLQAQSDFSLTFKLTIGAMAALLLAIGSALYFVLTNVARPIETITSAMRRLADGDVANQVPFVGRTDEIGDMAGAVEVFRKNALENARLEAEANDNRTSNERERERQSREQAQRATAMERATSGLGDALRHLAEGDLEFRLKDMFAPDFERLRTDFNTAADTLRETLTEVARTTGSIDGGSAEISGSVDDLSKRTEQQAAALEETAAALDQITANVAQSATRADEARNAARLATHSTNEGGLIVSEAVDAMIKIENSSEQIAGIIGVIDEIAFQTNLLALNAGVEAARAGEAGKGFAVVAQEVRELAQRSATAAREIKKLIQQSGVDVGNGVKLVRGTGEALKAIEGHVAAINHNMEAIAISAKEQSTGLRQVNTAVNQMDQVTQQNAAMVEETNAASASLATEATILRDLVGRFVLGQADAERSGGTRHLSAAANYPAASRPKLSVA